MRANIVELSKVAGHREFRNYVFDFLGDLSAYDILGDRVLIATYIPPERTSGGIIRPEAKVGESRFTGVVGLLIKHGRTAFKYDGQFEFEGAKPPVGSWVQYRRFDAHEFFLGPRGDLATKDHGISCRLIESGNVMAVIDDPNRLGPGNGFENL